MSEGEGISIDTSAEERALAKPIERLDLPPMSSETWELIKFRLMGELNARLWTVIGRAIAVVAVLIALVTSAGYFEIPAYIQSIFKEKIEQETKKIEELREGERGEQAAIYAHEKIFAALFDTYLRDQQTMSKIASKALDEINQSDALNSPSMSELKNFMINGIRKIVSQTMSVEEYQTFKQEITTKLPGSADLLRGLDPRLTGSHSPPGPPGPLVELLWIYPHISALDKTLSWSIERLVTKETKDPVTKSVLLTTWENSFYPKYGEELDTFTPGNSDRIRTPSWRTLFPDMTTVFPSLSPNVNMFSNKRVQ